MTAVEAAIVEITEKLAEFAPQHEGLRDFTRLNLKEATQAEVAASLALYDTRVALLLAAKAACEALMADGHPDIAVREISGEAYADLTENDTTVHAAYSRFALARRSTSS